MNDTINRQAAIKYLMTNMNWYDEDGYETDEDEKEDAIKDLINGVPSAQQWIPCSERLPESEDMYQIPDKRYLCQLEAYGQRKFCVCSRLKGAVSAFWDWYGVPFKDSEVVAWMPLPEPYKT